MSRLMFPNVAIQDMTQLGPSNGDVYHMWDTAYTLNGSLSLTIPLVRMSGCTQK